MTKRKRKIVLMESTGFLGLNMIADKTATTEHELMHPAYNAGNGSTSFLTGLVNGMIEPSKRK